MRKIILSVNSFRALSDKHLTGGLISNYVLAESLNKKADLLVICPSCDCSSDEKLKNFNVFKIKQTSMKGMFNKILFMAKLFVVIFKNSSSSTLLLSTTSTIPVSYLISKLLSAKSIIICRAYEDFKHTLTGYDPTSVELNPRIKRFSSLIYQLAYRNSQIITNSVWMKDVISNNFRTRKKITVLYPPINKSNIITEPTTDRDLVIGFINRGADKGHEIVIELALKHLDKKFKVFGDLTVFSDFRLTNNIELVGWRPQSYIFNNIDLLLVPSKWPEPFGRVSIESQINLIPVLVSSTGGLPETVFIEDFIVDGGFEEWDRALRLLIINYKDYKNNLHVGSKWFDKFGMDNHEKIVECILKDI